MNLAKAKIAIIWNTPFLNKQEFIKGKKNQPI